MKGILALLTILMLLSFSQDKNECDEHSVPYWLRDINSRVEEDNITLWNIFKKIRQTETNIEPANGFITLRIHISKTGNFCNMETFQIDQNYDITEFNNGKLVEELKTISMGLTDWKRDNNYETYNLDRLKME
jgi:hypothetical protein